MHKFFLLLLLFEGGSATKCNARCSDKSGTSINLKKEGGKIGLLQIRLDTL